METHQIAPERSEVHRRGLMAIIPVCSARAWRGGRETSAVLMGSFRARRIICGVPDVRSIRRLINTAKRDFVFRTKSVRLRPSRRRHPPLPPPAGNYLHRIGGPPSCPRTSEGDSECSISPFSASPDLLLAPIAKYPLDVSTRRADDRVLHLPRIHAAITTTKDPWFIRPNGEDVAFVLHSSSILFRV